ncbi:MAG TPA: aminoglycoside phosphotransferase family protein [Candidatus Saccharimonadia bacterium]
MNHTPLLTSAEPLAAHLLVLQQQGRLPGDLQLVGLLGTGHNASVFAAVMNDTHHIIKVYASAAQMRKELYHLKRVSPGRSRLIVIDEPATEFDFVFFILEQPPGRQLLSGGLTPGRSAALASQLAGLYQHCYAQSVSVRRLGRELRYARRGLTALAQLQLEPAPYQQLLQRLEVQLSQQSEQLAVPQSLIHGDLWWPNLIAADPGAYIIDWDRVRRADPAEDLAKLRLGFWFPKNAFPSRNFFWTAPTHGARVAQLMQAIADAYQSSLGDSLLPRLRFYAPLMGLHLLAQLANGRSIVEPSLRPSLYQLLAADSLRLAEDPLAPIPDLTGTEYYALIERSRRERLDGHPGPPG